CRGRGERRANGVRLHRHRRTAGAVAGHAVELDGHLGHVGILSRSRSPPECDMARILLVIGDAAEVLDTFYPYHRLQEEGYAVDVAGPEARAYHLVLHERPDGWDITEERPGYKLKATVAFRDVDPTRYDALVISGGRAPEYLRYDAELLRVTRAMFAAN